MKKAVYLPDGYCAIVYRSNATGTAPKPGSFYRLSLKGKSVADSVTMRTSRPFRAC